MEAIKKNWCWRICLVYAYFFKHLCLGMLISFMIIRKECRAIKFFSIFLGYEGSENFSRGWDRI